MLEHGEWNFVCAVIAPLITGPLVACAFAALYSLQNSDLPYLQKLRKNVPVLVGCSLPVALLGYVAGYLTGMSRSPAVGTVLPAVLTLIGGLNIYLFGESKNRVVIGYNVFLFTLLLFYGAHVGAFDRQNGIEERLTNLSQQELRIRIYRNNLGLSEDPPSWITGIEKGDKKD